MRWTIQSARCQEAPPRDWSRTERRYEHAEERALADFRRRAEVRQRVRRLLRPGEVSVEQFRLLPLAYRPSARGARAWRRVLGGCLEGFRSRSAVVTHWSASYPISVQLVGEPLGGWPFWRVVPRQPIDPRGVRSRSNLVGVVRRGSEVNSTRGCRRTSRCPNVSANPAEPLRVGEHYGSCMGSERNGETHLRRASETAAVCNRNLSLRSDGAMQAAASLANRRGAHLTLLHILRARPTPGHTDLLQGRLSAQLARTTLHGDSVPAFALRVGRKTSTIAQAAAESSADLVILVSRRGALLRPCQGRPAERVVAQARRPVLVVNSDGLLQYDGIVMSRPQWHSRAVDAAGRGVGTSRGSRSGNPCP